MEERRDAVISSLVKYLGPEASTYIHYEEKVCGYGKPFRLLFIFVICILDINNSIFTS